MAVDSRTLYRKGGELVVVHANIWKQERWTLPFFHLISFILSSFFLYDSLYNVEVARMLLTISMDELDNL